MAGVTFDCPRCGTAVADEDLYGPCTTCRSQLRAAYAGEAREVETAEYEPKMNVTPNAVGTARSDA
jgi:Zn finger protein HypA/HybF involved in hydrogenase expression